MKGLEPEIQRLIAKHKAEVQKIKVLHEVRPIHPYIAVYNIVGGILIWRIGKCLVDFNFVNFYLVEASQ